jgi:hypothetical protein
VKDSEEAKRGLMKHHNLEAEDLAEETVCPIFFLSQSVDFFIS